MPVGPDSYPPLTDTIAAIATPPGIGSVGIVRISGSKAFAIADALTRPKTPSVGRRGHSLHRARVYKLDAEDVIDDGLLAIFHAPHSFTGEDVVEFQGHGGPLVIKQVFAAFLDAGARAARPGEFSERAFANSKLDLAQAEAIADLIGAETAAAARAARRQLSGELSFAVQTCTMAIKQGLAFLEAAIDFPEEVGEVNAPAVSQAITMAQAQLGELLAGANYGRRLREGITLVLAGYPNAGKSSLLNRLSGTDRAIVTPHAGTTRDVLEEALEIHGMPVRAWDTAGLRDTDDPIEQIGIQRARQAVQDADIVIVVLDATVPLALSTSAWLQSLQDRAVVVALNKADAVSDHTLKALRDSVEGALPSKHAVPLSARSGDGIGALTQAIADTLTDGAVADLLVTSARHEEALRRTLDALGRAQLTLEAGLPPELVAVDAHAALQSLGEITGETTREDIIADIFSQFCIGK